jgi:transmembrane sensor
MMNEKWNQYFFGEPTEEEKRELFQEVEKNEDMKREFAEMQNIIGLSGLLPREDDSLKGERNLEAMMNRQEKKLRRKRVLQVIRYTTSAAAMIARLVYACWFGDSLLYGDYSSEGATGTFNSAGW